MSRHSAAKSVRDARGEIAREQRRVVVAEILAEEGQAARQPAALDGERKQEQDVRRRAMR